MTKWLNLHPKWWICRVGSTLRCPDLLMSAFEGAYAKALQLGAPRGHQVQLCFNIATGVVFWVCFLWEDLLGSLCFVESCSATSQRFNPKSAVFFSQAFPVYFVWCFVQLCAVKKPVRYKRSHSLSQMKSLKGWHLKRTVVFWPPFCMPEICPPNGNLSWGLAKIGSKCRQSIRKVGHY